MPGRLSGAPAHSCLPLRAFGQKASRHLPFGRRRLSAVAQHHLYGCQSFGAEAQHPRCGAPAALPFESTVSHRRLCGLRPPDFDKGLSADGRVPGHGSDRMAYLPLVRTACARFPLWKVCLLGAMAFLLPPGKAFAHAVRFRQMGDPNLCGMVSCHRQVCG